MILFSDVRDIHDVLEVTVYDEDSAHKYEFLGKVRNSESAFFWRSQFKMKKALTNTNFLER
jgi:hypothetical protein